MPKICNHPQCNYPVFGKGYCRFHQYLRKKDKTKMVLTPKPYAGVNDLNVNSEVELFDKLWETREHVSFLSGRKINIEPKSNFWYNIFAHVLAKGKAKFPGFKLYSKNIIFLLPEEHNLLDFCSEDDRKKYAERNMCDWNKVYLLREELKEEYKKITFN